MFPATKRPYTGGASATAIELTLARVPVGVRDHLIHAWDALARACETGNGDRGQGERALGPRRFAERLRAEKFGEKAKVRFTIDPLKVAVKARDVGWVGVRLKTSEEKSAEADTLEAEDGALAAIAAESRRTAGVNDTAEEAAA